MSNASLLKFTSRPNKKLFFQSPDKNDRKFGDIVTFAPKNYDKSKYVLLGCPQDEGVKRNHGRVGAAKAPDKIRECFYKLNAPTKIKEGDLFDFGNSRIGKTLEHTHKTHEQIVSQILIDGKRVIVLGGGNDISYPDCKALSENSKNVLAINIDNHFDVRENKKRNSGTPYRQLLEDGHIKPNNFYELASQSYANSETYREYLKKKKVNVITLEQLRSKGISNTVNSILKQRQAQVIFWGFDMDSVRSSDAPGVSATNPTGLTADEAILFATAAGKEKRSRIFEITEVNPNYDIDNRTCKLAALIIREFLS